MGSWSGCRSPRRGGTRPAPWRPAPPGPGPITSSTTSPSTFSPPRWLHRPGAWRSRSAGSSQGGRRCRPPGTELFAGRAGQGSGHGVDDDVPDLSLSVAGEVDRRWAPGGAGHTCQGNDSRHEEAPSRPASDGAVSRSAVKRRGRIMGRGNAVCCGSVVDAVVAKCGVEEANDAHGVAAQVDGHLDGHLDDIAAGGAGRVLCLAHGSGAGVLGGKGRRLRRWCRR